MLGEQSAKSLRGDAMMDVIFNGSGNRKPAGMAEVTLVFENPRRADETRLLNIDTDEVDPIAEAEVYLAYGRDAQAEEILKEALKKDPQRQEIYLKLLEIHSQHNKPSAFETVASELYSVSGGQGETWQKAMALGRQLDPRNPLFAEAGSAAAFAAAAAESEASPQHQAAAEPVASDTQVFSVPPDLKPEPKFESRDKPALDFTFDDEISPSPATPTPSAKSPAAILAGAEHEVAKATRQPGDGEEEKAAAVAAPKIAAE